MTRKNKIVFIFMFVLFCLLCPLSVNAATNEYYWSTTLSESSYSIFQENSTNQIDTEAIITMNPTGAYKYVFYNGKNYIAMNNAGGYSDDLSTTLANMSVTKKDVKFKFSLFCDKDDYTPKEYNQMLKRSKIYIYDKNDKLVKSMSALDYKDYVKFPSSKNFNVKFNHYNQTGEVNTGVNLTVSWDISDNESPLLLLIKNDTINYSTEYDITNMSKKNSISLDLELACNGKYTFYLVTSVNQYEKILDFDNLSYEPIDLEDAKKDETYKEEEPKISEKDVTISVSDIPSKLETGQSFKLTITTNVNTTIDLSGRVDSTYQKKHKFNITANGTYLITAVSESGKSATKKIKVNCFVDPKPDINYYDRDSYWSGDQTPIDDGEKLAQTGMYDNTVLVVALILLFSGLLILAQVLRKVGITWKRK